jgi:ABC-type multidrug transport system fused ATPase/permease subunit
VEILRRSAEGLPPALDRLVVRALVARSVASAVFDRHGPIAALGAETEQFERYASAAKGSTPDGRITILVSHRFSTVRMADLIVVLDGARVVEVGSHEALMAKGGQYAELYGIQAAAYR